MQIVLTKKISALSGQVTDAKGNPVLDATVVVFPSNEKLWTYQSRFIKAARPDQDGRYRVTALPGRKAIWWSRCRASKTARPAIPSFSRRSRTWRRNSMLGDGETKAVDVKLSAPQKSQSAQD